jgi:alpha,alpha-trehalase
MFDDYLRRRAEARGQEFVPFDSGSDYRTYVDGKLRYDGVRGFLESRGIHLPQGDPSDPPERETVCGLGNRKNALVQELLTEQGVDVFESSVAWLRSLREAGFKTAVVSASKNCRRVLEVAVIGNLFDIRVDGEVAARLGLPGKPAPDTFLEAARELGVAPERAVVVEDAISGVQAGRAGGFGLVIGVDREGDAPALREGGAHVVVSDLAELHRAG